jgi:hypothetical protein
VSLRLFYLIFVRLEKKFNLQRQDWMWFARADGSIPASDSSEGLMQRNPM